MFNKKHNFFNIKHHFSKRWERHYAKSHWPIIVDIASIFAVLAILALFVGLHKYNPDILLSLTNFNGNKTNNGYILDLSQPPLEIKAEFKDLYISLDEPVSVLSIDLKNKAPEEIINLEIEIKSLNQNLIVNEINSEFEGVSIDNNKIKISRLTATEEKNIKLKINWLINNFSGQKADIKLDYNYNINKQDVKNTEIITSPRVESGVKGRAIILYTGSEGDKLGLGPIPPVAELPTNYWLFFEVENEGDLENFIMYGRLADNVKPTANYSLLDGEFYYDEDNKQVIWKIEKIENNESGLRLGLEIQLIPSLEQIGKVVELIGNINYSATDPVSGKELKGSLKPIDSNLPDDKFNKGMGEIKKLTF